MSDNSQQAPSPEQLAELLPQYGIESFIAQGGMGAVYKGRQLSLDRDVAIKLLLNEFGGDAEFLASFSTEAKAMARLNNPNLLGVFDFGDLDGMPYIVMEYVNGGSLHEAAWEQAIEPTQAVTIVKGICDGLAHAHEHDIVHRDIKPSNILLTLNAEPKVADFGLAQAIDSDQPGLAMGTPGYTAPEVFQDPSQAGKLADIYSVGVILHQLLTGIDPAGSMEPPSKPVGNLRLDAIWRKATNIDPAQRYASIAAMSSDLEKWLSAKKSAPASSGPKPYRPPTAPLQSTNSGGGMGGKIFLIIILLVVVGVAFQQLQKKKQQNKETTENKAPVEVKVVEVKSVPDTTSAPPDPVDPDMDEEPEIVEEDMDDEPDIPEVVETDDDTEDEPAGDLPPGDPELRERAIGLILDARKKRDKELADNARELRFQLVVHSRDAEPLLEELIENLKEEIVDDRVPRVEGVLGLTNDVIEDFDRAIAKEESIDASHRSDLKIIRDAYATRLKGAADETTDEELKARLLAQAERAEDLDTWVDLLSPDTKAGPRKAAGDFAGKWINRSYNNESQWIAHPDGKLEVVGENWDVTWEILADGTLQVDWNKKKPYIYTQDGDGWTGTNPHGGKATLTPGDW